MSSPTSLTATETSLGTSDFLPLASSHHLEVEEYLRLITANAFSSEGQEQLDQHTVIKLEHMKDEGQAQHEHIIASIKDHNNNIVRLSIGRSKGQNEARKRRSQNKSPYKSYSSSNSTLALASIPNSSQDSIFKPTAAMDVVQNISENTTTLRSRAKSVFEPRHPFPLLRLAVIIATVHDQNSLYTVLDSQCYWFAMLIMGVSMAQGGRVTSFIEKNPKSKAKASPEPVVKILNPLTLSDPSEWTEIPILPEEPYETVRDLGPSTGKHNNVTIVTVGIDEIRAVALESQRRYEAQLDKLERKRSGYDRQIREARKQIEASKKEAEEANQKALAAREEIAILRKQLAAQQGTST